MQLRAPAYPLITVDPYFSVWSPSNKLNESNTVHWTNSPNTISGVATVDGKKYRVIGNTASNIPTMKQISSNCTAFSTIYTFEEGGARLTLTFSTPLLITDLALISRPVSYLEIKNESADGKRHDVKFEISVSEEICINLLKEEAVEYELIDLGTLKSAKIGSKAQKIAYPQRASAKATVGKIFGIVSLAFTAFIWVLFVFIFILAMLETM